VQPFERLRHLARFSGDGAELVSEAADCLAGFADDPAGLVVACRRLLAYHPAAGPLWWLCARVLTAPDAAQAAWDAWELVNEDSTYERVAELLPFPHDEPIAIVGQPELAETVAATRPDLDVVAVRMRARRGLGLAAVRTVDQTELLALEPSHLLVEASAVSPDTAAVPLGTDDLLDALSPIVTWLVAGAGHVLPARFFGALERQLAAAGADQPVELLELTRFARVAGPVGLDPPDAIARRIDCPVAPELLRLGG
jgi:hypothetical protein